MLRKEVKQSVPGTSVSSETPHRGRKVANAILELSKFQKLRSSNKIRSRRKVAKSKGGGISLCGICRLGNTVREEKMLIKEGGEAIERLARETVYFCAGSICGSKKDPLGYLRVVID